MKKSPDIHLSDIETLLEDSGLRPTTNRIMVLRGIMEANRPLSLTNLEHRLETLDKSSIFRTLSALQEHSLVHSFEDGRGIELYEICSGHGKCDDIHSHFYCLCCRKVFCFDSLPAPIVPLPEGFTASSVNYMLKGLCPDCRNHSEGHLHRTED